MATDPAIREVTVLGAGVMGAAIAAHLGNAGLRVRLLDIVPRDAAAGADHKEVTDELVLPLLRKGADGKARAIIKDGDACFFYNFRADRARQLTLALWAADADFPHFDRAPRPKLAAFATMTQYDAKVPVPAVYAPQSCSTNDWRRASRFAISACSSS